MKDYSDIIHTFEQTGTADFPGIYPGSVTSVSGGMVFMADEGESDMIIASCPGFFGTDCGSYTRAPLTHDNAAALRRLVPYTKPIRALSRPASFGAGDRLGVAGTGHLRVFSECDVAPVISQQSMRELTLTNRTFADVLDTATFNVFREGFKKGFGADGDHLKRAEDIRQALDTGCTMITLDCSDHIVNGASSDEDIYGGALRFAEYIWNEFFADGRYDADMEISIDETETPTTPAQHRYIAQTLGRAGVHFTSLAPRFCGEFQKGIDYIGDLAQFEREFREHAAIADDYGYKISVHSGSDKFSIFPIVRKYCGGRFHTKTAGTSWLEAMRICAKKDPALYREVHALALERFTDARAYYRVTTDLDKVPALSSLSDSELPSLFDNDDARQLIHITYGFILQDPSFNRRLFKLWRDERQAYSDALYGHIGRHIELLTGKSLRGSNINSLKEV